MIKPIYSYVGKKPPAISEKSFCPFRARSGTKVTPRKMKEVISYFFHKNADLASIASVGAAVGIGILFVFAPHRWSVPSLAQEPVASGNMAKSSAPVYLVLPNENVDSSKIDI
jgi:hypothetical protein